MEKASLAAPARSTESSDELSVAAAVEGMSLTSRGSHEPQPEMPPGVGNAPDVHVVDCSLQDAAAALIGEHN